jgi:hypothetical protein
MTPLEERLQRLEDIEAIRHLKAAYFHACDRKDTDTLRACFTAGPLVIDYAAIGRFETCEAFIDCFRALGGHAHIIDMHHGQNAQIHWESPTEAHAVWDLYFFQINTESRTLTQLAGFYRDRYVKQEGAWKIVETVFTPTSTMMLDASAEVLKPLMAG